MKDDDARSADDSASSARRLSALIAGYQASAAIGALARLGVADALAAGPAHGRELALRVGAHEDALTRLIEATLDVGIIETEADGRYRLTALGELLRSDVPGSMQRYAIVSTEDWRWNGYCHLEHTLRTGEPGFAVAQGCRLWDYLATHPAAAASFAESLARIGAARDRAMVAAVDFDRFSCVVDVGGGRGGFLCSLLAARPSLRGILFDLPSIVDEARETLRRAGLVDRCDVVAGDFRKSVPRGGDVYLLSWILHDWDDETAGVILSSCRRAMDANHSLLVVEMVVPEKDQPGADAIVRLVRQTDLEMLAVVGGRERTAAQLESLLIGAGFSVTSVTPLPGMPWSVVEAVAV